MRRRKALQPEKKSKSLIRGVLWGITKAVSLVVSIGSIFSYVIVLSSRKKQKIQEVKDYVKYQLLNLSSFFKTAESNLNIFKSEFLRIYNSDYQITEEEFWEYYFLDDDGAIRMKPKYFNGVLNSNGVYSEAITSFIGSNQKIDDWDFQRRLMISYKLLQKFGPAWQNNFANVHVSYPENAISVYWPQQPWGLKSQADLPMNELETIKATTQKENPERKPVWSAMYYDETARDWVITYQLPVDFEGKHLINPSHDIYLKEFLNNLISNKISNTYNFVLNQDGYLIAYPGEPTHEQKLMGHISLEKANIPSVTRAYYLIKDAVGFDFTGVKVIENTDDHCYLIVGKIQGPDWWLVTVLPKGLVQNAAKRSAALIGLGGVFALLSTLSLVFYVMHNQVSKPLKLLRNAADAIGKGDYSSATAKAMRLPLGLNNEIGVLAKRFKEMSTRIRNNKQNLEKIVDERTAELEKANLTLRQISSLDGLTQVYNRRSFEIDIEKIFSAAQSTEGVFSILMADIDFFKLYNDSYGHAEGDSALREIAKLIKDSIRGSDRVYRYGGEEFAVVFPNTNLKTAHSVARRILNNIKAERIKHKKSTYNYVTISGGLVEYSRSFQNPQQMIKAADKKLYQAKHSGRNNLVI